MPNKLIRRVLFIIVLFASVFLAPWWVTVPIAVVGLFLFNAPEVVVAGIFLDALYGAPLPQWFEFQFFFSTLFVLLYIVIFYGKRRLIAYS